MTRTTRRSFLRGTGGTALSLPMLESIASASEPPRPARRMAFFYVPIGVVRRGFFPSEQDTELFTFNGDVEFNLTNMSVSSNWSSIHSASLCAYIRISKEHRLVIDLTYFSCSSMSLNFVR